MKPEPEMSNLSHEALFELLESPEAWPEDPEIQAQLADLLELHLALQAHGSELRIQPLAAQNSPEKQRQRRSYSWLMVAAAAVAAMVPTVYAVQHTRTLAAQAKDRARLEAVAQRRGQDRLWAAFFQQSSDMLQKFDHQPSACTRDKEDRNVERELASALLQASHQLAAQGAPNLEAESMRTNLHAWLTEVSLEEGCMEPRRADELRQWAQARKLEDESQRLGRLLKGEAE